MLDNSSCILMAFETTPSVPGEPTLLDHSTAFGIYLTFTNMVPWVILSTGIVGIAGNILIILFYLRLGFSECIHMSFVALAVSDLGSVLTSVWPCAYFLPSFTQLFQRFFSGGSFAHFMNFTGGWPHMAFSRTTALITAWVSFERCLCVIFPTKVKVMITRTVTKAVLVTIFVIGFSPLLFGYVGYRFTLLLDSARNQTVLFVSYNANNELNQLNSFAFALYGIVYPVFSLTIVVLCTVFLVIKIRQSAAWRKRNASKVDLDTEGTRRGKLQRRKASSSTNHVTKTVVSVAVVFIVCCTPISAHIFTAFLVRPYSIGGSMKDLFWMNAKVVFLLSEINSSLNVFVFTIVGTKFRSTLFELFTKKPRVGHSKD